MYIIALPSSWTTPAALRSMRYLTSWESNCAREPAPSPGVASSIAKFSFFHELSVAVKSFIWSASSFIRRVTVTFSPGSSDTSPWPSPPKPCSRIGTAAPLIATAPGHTTGYRDSPSSLLSFSSSFLTSFSSFTSTFASTFILTSFSSWAPLSSVPSAASAGLLCVLVAGTSAAFPSLSASPAPAPAPAPAPRSPFRGTALPPSPSTLACASPASLSLSSGVCCS
mmetsp:Transcript_62457/g.146813  ORF Transcript_62457/g.146813 Transcript_62457/m.146813 type:complete len:225 (-) Transcript_62457:69-743(-)